MSKTYEAIEALLTSQPHQTIEYRADNGRFFVIDVIGEVPGDGCTVSELMPDDPWLRSRAKTDPSSFWQTFTKIPAGRLIQSLSLTPAHTQIEFSLAGIADRIDLANSLNACLPHLVEEQVVDLREVA